MTIDDLLEQLTRLREEHGNQTIKTWGEWDDILHPEDVIYHETRNQRGDVIESFIVIKA